MLRASLLVAVAVAAVALAGCGGIKEKDVTKAQYEQQLQQIGDDLFRAANNLGQSTATGIFNANVQKLQDTIHDSADSLDAMRPPGVKAQAANDDLIRAYRDLADQFDHVKDARRDSYPKAIAALLAVQHSEPATASIRAAERLRKLGFRVPVSATIGSGT